MSVEVITNGKTTSFTPMKFFWFFKHAHFINNHNFLMPGIIRGAVSLPLWHLVLFLQQNIGSLKHADGGCVITNLWNITPVNTEPFPVMTDVTHNIYMQSNWGSYLLMHYDSGSKSLGFVSHRRSCAEVSGKLFIPNCICLPSSDRYLVDENCVWVAQKVWGLIPTAGHVLKCRANCSFQTASAYPAVMGTWWIKTVYEWLRLLVHCILAGEIRLL